MKDDAVRLRGAPTQLEGMVETELWSACAAMAPIHLVLDELAVEAVVSRFDLGSGVAKLTAAVPTTTPPGEREGRLVAVSEKGDKIVVAAVIVVEPYRAVVPSPGSFSFIVEAGGTSTLHLSLFNQGNVPLDIPKVQAFGIFRDNGLEDSLSAVYRDKSKQGLDRVAALADELPKHHELVRLTFRDGPRVVDPNEMVSLAAEVMWPDHLVPNSIYGGTLAFGELSLQFVVESKGGPLRKSRKKAVKK